MRISMCRELNQAISPEHAGTHFKLGGLVRFGLVKDVDEVKHEFGRRDFLVLGEVSFTVAVERVEEEHVSDWSPLLLVLVGGAGSRERE